MVIALFVMDKVMRCLSDNQSLFDDYCRLVDGITDIPHGVQSFVALRRSSAECVIAFNYLNGLLARCEDKYQVMSRNSFADNLHLLGGVLGSLSSYIDGLDDEKRRNRSNFLDIMKASSVKLKAYTDKLHTTGTILLAENPSNSTTSLVEKNPSNSTTSLVELIAEVQSAQADEQTLSTKLGHILRILQHIADPRPP